MILPLVAGCGVEEVALEPFRGDSPRERYEEALERAGLWGATLTREWHQAGQTAIESPVDVVPPLFEEVFLPAGRPRALGYLIEAERGQRIQVRVASQDRVSRVFVEIHRIRERRGEESGLLVSWAEEWERELTYDATTSGRYIATIQPEIMAGGAVEVSIDVGPSLSFPVEGGSMDDIGSVFGDARDGGARDHHGVDIFAPRGTPVLAAAPGEVYRVEVTGLGGKVVWVRDSSGQVRQYYAHLDSQMVRRGQEVEIGDVLGVVGNTGNARLTPPHLHFGVYVRRGGAVDPHYFMDEPGGAPAELAVSRDAFSGTLRADERGTVLRSAASDRSEAAGRIPGHGPVEVLGGSGTWFRVRAPTGEEGYVRAVDLETVDEPLETRSSAGRVAILQSPDEGAPTVRHTREGESLFVLGRWGSWTWVAGEGDAPMGWLVAAVE